MQITVGNKNINIRKWKGKDKKNFINALKNPDVQKSDIMNALVYDCIDENVILSDDEFRFVISRIRALSLGEEFTVEFYCEDCGNTFEQEFLLKDVIRYSYKKLDKIDISGANIKFGEPKNLETYINKVQQDSDYDFLLRIEEINGNNTFTLDELENIINDLDIDVLEEVMSIYDNAKFTVVDTHEVECACGKKQMYKFDDIPGFFPNSWFE